MSRWAPDAAARLHGAAIDLFIEQGFAATTVPQITARAGMTTRSFFRYYADKREVLFAGEDELPRVVAQMFESARPAATPMELMREGFRDVVVPKLESLREEFLRRDAVIRTDEGLRERELRKLLILHDTAIVAFQARGLSELDADVAAHVAVTVYDIALHEWLRTSATQQLDQIFERVLARVGAVAADH
jgi:AcrR family transcriptional regulator